MTKVLEKLEPTKVFKYFEDICNIPHGSGNVKQISDYCVQFAKEHHLKYYQDELFNVIIIKEASEGYEKVPTVILQGHLDMVCEKNVETKHDFITDPLDLRIDGDYVYANGTTLGGDDGIAIAYSLAILDSEIVKHPRLEVIFTVDEETGMYGAHGLDTSMLIGKYMLNLDSEDEGVLITSCAGGLKASINFTGKLVETKAISYRVSVKGLKGGHSGTEIDKGRANAIKILARVLYNINMKYHIDLASINGGLKDNAIPREASANILIDEKDINSISELINKLSLSISNEYKSTDENILICFEKNDDTNNLYIDNGGKIIKFLYLVENGIKSMSFDIANLVESSQNVGVISTNEGNTSICISIRSSKESILIELKDRIDLLATEFGGKVNISGKYPAWEYRSDSRLREIAIQSYESLYGSKPLVEAIHAGLECGILSSKIIDIDIVAMGPDILDIHTPDERLSISSVNRTWNYILLILKNSINLL